MEEDEKREHWWYPVDPNKLTKEQQKKVQAGVIQQMVKVIFQTHFYEWEGRLYRQILGGP